MTDRSPNELAPTESAPSQPAPGTARVGRLRPGRPKGVARWPMVETVGLVLALLLASSLAVADPAGSGSAGVPPATADVGGHAEAEQDSLDALLESESLKYVDAKRCLQAARVGRSEVVNENLMIFHVGRKLYANELGGQCRGLRKTSQPRFSLRGARMCRLDRFRVQDGSGRLQSPAYCVLGQFVQINRDQAAQLRGDEHRNDTDLVTLIKRIFSRSTQASAE